MTEKFEVGDKVVIDVLKAREPTSTDTSALFYRRTSEEFLRGEVVRVGVSGLYDVFVSKLSLNQWTDSDALESLLCRCGSKRLWHDEKEEWLCPFCDL